MNGDQEISVSNGSVRPKIVRRKFLIFPRFQLLLLGVNLGVTIAVSVIIWFQMRSALADLKPAAALSGYPVEFFRRYLEYHSKTFQTSLLIALVLGLILSTALTLLLSHRFAGPIIRLRNFFREIGEGTDSGHELSFRDGDYLRDLPPVINRAVKVLKENSRRKDRTKVS